MEQFFTDLWQNVQTYYSDFVAFLPKLVAAIIVFIVLYFLANAMRNFAHRRLSQRMDDALLARFLARIIKTVMMVIALLLALQIIGLSGIAVGLLSTAGVGAFIIGFAFKDLGENFLAGVMLAFNRPFKIGDSVQLDGMEGTIVGLNLRNTQIKTYDGKDVFIPNANIIKKPVVNYTIDGFLRLEFFIGLDYNADVNKAIQIIHQTIKDVPGVLQQKKRPLVYISDPATSALNLVVYFWIDTFDPKVDGLQVKTDVVRSCFQALNAAGIYLPSSIIELKNYNNSKLTTKATVVNEEVA